MQFYITAINQTYRTKPTNQDSICNAFKVINKDLAIQQSTSVYTAQAILEAGTPHRTCTWKGISKGNNDVPDFKTNLFCIDFDDNIITDQQKKDFEEVAANYFHFWQETFNSGKYEKKVDKDGSTTTERKYRYHCYLVLDRTLTDLSQAKRYYKEILKELASLNPDTSGSPTKTFCASNHKVIINEDVPLYDIGSITLDPPKKRELRDFTGKVDTVKLIECVKKLGTIPHYGDWHSFLLSLKKGMETGEISEDVMYECAQLVDDGEGNYEIKLEEDVEIREITFAWCLGYLKDNGIDISGVNQSPSFKLKNNILKESSRELLIEQFNDGELDYCYNERGRSIEGIQWEKDEETEELKVKKYITIINAKVKVSHKVKNVETGEFEKELTWLSKRNQSPISKVVPSDVLASSRSIVELSKYDLNVTSSNASKVVEFLSAYQDNFDIPTRQITDRLGFKGDKFVLPHKTLMFDGTTTIEDNTLSFHSHDNASQSIIEAIKSTGSLETWKAEIFDKAKEYPIVLTFILSQFASVMLPKLDIPSFIIELALRTSTGKSLTTAISNTVWGHPTKIRKGWNLTQNSIEALLHLHQNIPVNLDDTKEAVGKTRLIEQIVYMISTGQGKGRMTKNLTSRDKKTWNLIVNVTGEQPINEMGVGGGAVARALTFKTPPFGTGETASKFGKSLNGVELENYGIAGEQFVSEWMKIDDTQLREIKERVKKMRLMLEDLVKGNEVMSRLAQSMAIIVVAGQLTKEWLGLDFNENKLHDAWMMLAEENKEVDRKLVALEYLMGQVNIHKNQFTFNQKGYYRDHTQLQGKIMGHLTDTETILLTPALQTFMQDEFPDWKTLLRDFRDEGWLNAKKGKLVNQRFIVTENKQSTCYVLRTEEVNLALGLIEVVPSQAIVDYERFQEHSPYAIKPEQIA